MNISGLFPSKPSYFIFAYFATWTLTKIDSVAELLIIPPPLFFNKKTYGNPIAFADQSTTIFSSSVNEGAIEKLKLGLWKVVAYIYAITEVTLIEEG